MTPRAPDLPRHFSQHTPELVALANHDTGATYTWAELDRRVGRVARVLSAHFSIGYGDRVCLIAENDPRVFELQFACMRIGAIFVPLNWRLALPELHAIVRDCEPALLVHDGSWRHVAVELAAEPATPTLAWDDPFGARDYEALQGVADPLDVTARSLEDYTHILYTSGTTGAPKGALSTHGTLLWQAVNLSHTSSITGPAHMLNPMPLFHAGGLLTVAMPLLHYGGRVTTMRRFQPHAVLAALIAAGSDISHLALIPMMYAALSAEEGFEKADLSGIRCGVVAGAIAPPKLLQDWFDRGARLQPQYGGTEMGPCALVLDPDQLEKAKLGSAGRPPLHTEIRLVDPATGSDVLQGGTGEIWLRGPSVTRGYWRDTGSDSFGADGWFRTGDAAWTDADGYFFYAGRTRERYKSGGENVYPAEVELVLGESPEVSEVAVIGVPHEKWGEVGVAVVVPTGGATPSAASLRAFAAGRLASYKLPVDVVIVDELARNVTGKVSRELLRQQYRAVLDGEAAYAR